jgi:hypothetical protein
MDVCLLWVLCVVFATGWSLVQRSPTSRMRRLKPASGLQKPVKEEEEEHYYTGWFLVTYLKGNNRALLPNQIQNFLEVYSHNHFVSEKKTRWCTIENATNYVVLNKEVAAHLTRDITRFLTVIKHIVGQFLWPPNSSDLTSANLYVSCHLQSTFWPKT